MRQTFRWFSLVIAVVVFLTIAWVVTGALAGRIVHGSVGSAVTQQRTDLYKSVYNGWKMWHVYCYRCHGMNAIATTLGPSLIEPSGQFSRAEFLEFVRTGNPDKGMPAWNKLLDDNQIVDIQTYVKARADKVLPPGRPDEVGPNRGPWVPPANWRAPR